MKKIAVILFLTGFPLILLAQEKSNPIKKVKQKIADKFPSNRFFAFEYETFSPVNYTSKMHNEDYEKGRIKNMDRLAVSMNYPIYKSRRLAITPHIQYKYESYRLTDMENNSIHYPALYHGKTLNSHYISASVRTTYMSKLFNKPALYTLSLAGDASDKGYERMTANFVGIIVLKRDAQTNFTVGLATTYDRTSPIPIFPLLSYEYKFKNASAFDLFFPKYLYFRKSLFTDGRLSLGTVLEKNRFFGHPKQEGLADSYNVAKTELKSGIVYEHCINKHFIFAIKGGIATPLKWNVTKKTSHKTIISYSTKPEMYFNVGFSYNL